MRKLISLLIVIILLGATIFVILRLWRDRRPPTQFGWRASVTALAGDGSPKFRDSVLAAQAGFSDPFGIAVAKDGVIYVADAGDDNRIRKLATDGSVSTFAGNTEGYADGQGTQAAFNTPSGIAVDTGGNIYVADTGNNRVRKITPAGAVSTLAGDGTAGYLDGPASQARFNGPIGIALDKQENIYVADTYNDRIRKITPGGEVSTVAGAGHPGYADGPAASAIFDTPCGIAVASDGVLVIADTGNNLLRKLTPDGLVTTFPITFPDGVNNADLRRPTGLVLTHDGFLYVTELERSRVVQIAADGAAHVVAGGGPGYANGAERARFNQIAGIAIDQRGDLYVTDAANYLVRKLMQPGGKTAASPPAPSPASETQMLPRLTSETLAEQYLLWPLDPQQRPHEVAATIGEVRGSFDSTEGRDHLHSGLDIFGAYGETVRAVRSEKVTSPLANWGFGDLTEGLRIGVISYIHIQVGRAQDGTLFNDSRFVAVPGADGKLARVRVRRGTRFRPGDSLGTINRMYHVHLNVGPPGAEINPLSLSPIGFVDTVPPVIEKDGIQLFDETGARLSEKRNGRLVVHGRMRIVVDAFDRTNLNVSRRRLGLYRLGYQLLKADGTPAPGFEQPRINLLFNRLPGMNDAVKLAYAEQSGITVYGSAKTRFLYEVTNTVRDGRAAPGRWDTSELPSGDYILRIIAADYSGNEAIEGRDVLITVR